MKTRLLKWMVRCSLPLSLLAILSGCSKNENPELPPALDGDIAPVTRLGGEPVVSQVVPVPEPVVPKRQKSPEPMIVGRIAVPEAKK